MPVSCGEDDEISEGIPILLIVRVQRSQTTYTLKLSRRTLHTETIVSYARSIVLSRVHRLLVDEAQGLAGRDL